MRFRVRFFWTEAASSGAEEALACQQIRERLGMKDG